MKIFPCRLSDGRRLPVLFRLIPSQPVLVPFLFVVLKRQYRAFNTIRNDLVAIKAFYEFHSLQNIDVDETLINGQLSLLMKNLEQFIAWLSIEKKAKNIVGRIGNKKLGHHYGIDPITRDGYLRSLKLFFTWCAQRYINTDAPKTDLENSFSSSLSSIASRFDSHLVTPVTRQVNFRSLCDIEIAAIRELSHPSCALNPFRKQNRLRNWLIIETFIETGIRIGELLILTTSSVNKGKNHYYVSVINRPDAGEDTRAKAPSLKTNKSQRTIGISESLYDRIQQYVIHERRPRRNNLPMKLKHGYLWVSERGKPLALNSVASMFSRIVTAIQSKNPDLLKSASPHSFRHTFAERFLEYLIEVKDFDMERAKDELRTICGWSDASSMPQYYARRYIHNMANLHNKDRVETAWKRLSEALPSFN
ncbi:site-specific integrase [Collimonas sp. H4R21]|uniref:Site-specific integrase n=1 Tax=Collimonas rhizosphaerae TaxID=3126357 RepID=A0ABU9PVH2_9BURK